MKSVCQRSSWWGHVGNKLLEQELLKNRLLGVCHSMSHRPFFVSMLLFRLLPVRLQEQLDLHVLKLCLLDVPCPATFADEAHRWYLYCPWFGKAVNPVELCLVTGPIGELAKHGRT